MAISKQQKWSRILCLCLLITMMAILPFIPTTDTVYADTPTWTIEGNKVYVDDINAYLSAKPNTLKGSGWVEFELISKNYEGNIDVVWGFDTSAGVTPSQPQIWADNVAHDKERWIDVEKAGQITLTNGTNFEVLTVGSEPADIGNENNTKLIRVEGVYSDPDLDSLDRDYSLVIAYNIVDQHSPSSATFYYNYTTEEKEHYVEYYPDYKPFAVSNFTQVAYEHLGVDQWWYLNTDAPIQANVTYKMRVWVDVPFTGLDQSMTKYVWGVKPSSETIQEAKSRGHLYLLDPWLSGGWSHRVKFTIDSGDIDAALTDFPVLVTLGTSVGITNADVSFVFDELQNDANRKKIAVTESDGTTECYVEIEKWDDANEQAWLWIKAPVIASGADTEFYLYFDADHANNDTYVGDTNDVVAENVWDANFILVDHLQDDPDVSHTRDSTDNDNDGTKKGANEPIEADGEVAKAQDFDGGDDYVEINSEILSGGAITVELIARPTANQLQNLFSIGGFDVGGWGTSVLIGLNTTNKFRTTLQDFDTTSGVFHAETAGVYDLNAFQLLSFTYDGSDGTQYKNGALVATAGGAGNFNAGAAPKTHTGNLYDSLGNNVRPFLGKIDELRVSDISRLPEWIKATYETCWDDLLTWSNEEHLPTTTTQAATGMDNGEITLHGNITDIGIGNCTSRGFVWDTASHADPGNVAPPATYADSWSEAGSFGTGAFTYAISGLTELTLYYYRAWALNPSGWAYGSEMEFFIGENGKVYRGVSPTLDGTTIAVNVAPTSVIMGNVFYGWSMPVWTNPATVTEQLIYSVDVPYWWDGESDILIHIHTATVVDESGNTYELDLTANHSTPNIVEAFPAAGDYNQVIQRDVGSTLVNAHYMEVFTLPYDHAGADLIVPDDVISFRIRNVDNGPADLADELIIVNAIVYFASTDYVDIEEVIEEFIADGTLIGGADVFYLMLAIIALGLLIAMVATRQSILGGGAAIFWAIFGAYSFTLSVTTWDIYYNLGFASLLGMVILSLYGAYAVREKRDTIADDEMDEEVGSEEPGFVDEQQGNSSGEEPVGSRRKALRQRAEERRIKVKRRR